MLTQGPDALRVVIDVIPPEPEPMARITRRVKAARDADFTARDEQGRMLNSVRNMGTLGGATLNIEDNYLIKKLFTGGLGVVSVENQART